MYSGTTLTKYSGRVMGAHQKIDRIARNHLSEIVPDITLFPTARAILAFEGRNGPDAIKRKSPAKDEPWHYYSPFDDDDSELIELIKGHYEHLVTHLKKADKQRTAFEAAWLAHAVTDGLTPAHHYPYEAKLVELRGEGKETRNTIKQKIIMQGDNRRDSVKKNWKMWGPKGLLSTHGMFEIGVAAIIAPLGLTEAAPKQAEIAAIEDLGPIEWFKRAAREIAVLNMYEAYYKKGWTPKLAWQVRHRLGPTIVQSVTLVWYSALRDAGLVEGKK